MDIIKSHTLERQKKIFTLKSNLQKAFNAGLNVDKEKFVCIACLELNSSRRTILEYIKILQGAVGFTDKAGLLELTKPEKENTIGNQG